jgi:soluble lytic murein transglycosylase
LQHQAPFWHEGGGARESPLKTQKIYKYNQLLVLCLLTFFAGFSSCKAETVFAEELSGVSLSFYRGLLVKAGVSDADAGELDDSEADLASIGGGKTAATLFESALESPNPFIRDASAEQLILPLLNKDIEPDRIQKLQAIQKNPFTSGETTLRASVFYVMGRYGDIKKLYDQTDPSPQTVPDVPLQTGSPPQAPGGKENPWDEALLLLAETRLHPGETKEKTVSFLFNSVPGDVVRWTLEEIRRLNPDALTGTENAAIEGRLAAARSAFSGGLILFRVVLEQEPDLFFRYPELLTDLGRCLQFASRGNEGLEVLQNMDRQLQAGTRSDIDRELQPSSLSGMERLQSPGAFSSESIPVIRYRLYYFAGRISRQRGQYRQSRDFFAQAILFAPDTLQSDACIWYILDTALTEGIGESAALVKSYISRWHDDPYFSDILDRLSRYLTANRQWQTIAEILPLIRDGSDRISTAKYAYITARAIMLGYTQTENITIAARLEAARPYFRLAYEAGESSYYYRALSASFLDESFLSLPAVTNIKDAFPHPEEMAFLRGFFQTGAASYFNPYLQKMAGDLNIPELRALAEDLHKAELYPELIRLVSEYMGREGYELTRRDLELYYPRPFLVTIEKNARAADLAPELLYGLIRTESAFQADIRSRAGAVGLTQLMPATAEEMAGRIRRASARGERPDYIGDGAPDLQNPEANIRIGAVYLSYLMNRMEHPLLAILAYNGGMNRIRRWYAASDCPVPGPGTSGPLPGDIFLETIEYAETREYGRRVLSAAAAYGYLFYDMSIKRLFTDIYK